MYAAYLAAKKRKNRPLAKQYRAHLYELSRLAGFTAKEAVELQYQALLRHQRAQEFFDSVITKLEARKKFKGTS
jgi:hypothetical protein